MSPSKFSASYSAFYLAFLRPPAAKGVAITLRIRRRYSFFTGLVELGPGIVSAGTVFIKRDPFAQRREGNQRQIPCQRPDPRQILVVCAICYGSTAILSEFRPTFEQLVGSKRNIAVIDLIIRIRIACLEQHFIGVDRGALFVKVGNGIHLENHGVIIDRLSIRDASFRIQHGLNRVADVFDCHPALRIGNGIVLLRCPAAEYFTRSESTYAGIVHDELIVFLRSKVVLLDLNRDRRCPIRLIRLMEHNL